MQALLKEGITGPLPATFSVTMIKYSGKWEKLKGESVFIAHSYRLQLIMEEKSRQQHLKAARNIMSTYKEQSSMNEYTVVLSSRFSFYTHKYLLFPQNSPNHS